MLDFLALSQNWPFTVAIMVVLIITIIECVGMFLGGGIGHLLESAFPTLEGELPSVDTHSAGLLEKALTWLRVGKLPLLVLLIIVLVCFGLAGMCIQWVVFKFIGTPLPGLIASIVSLFASLPAVRLVANGISRMLPKDESSAISLDDLVGRVATITLGTARHKNPTRAKVIDNFGQAHYVLLAPDLPDAVFQTGESVLIIKRAGAIFYAIENSHDVLISE